MSDVLALPKPPAAPVKITTDLVRFMLRKRYPSPEWAFLEEVAPRTGGGSGYADGVAVNLWHSRGHAIHGFEIKVSRADWLKELRQPAKAEGVFQYCNAWWIVAPKGILKDHELPPTWGLIEAGPASLRVVRAGAALEPRPVTLAFFASLVRRAEENVAGRAAGLVRTQLDESRQRIDEAIASGVREKSREFAKLEGAIEAFKKSTGLEICPYSGPPIETIRLAQRLELLSGYDRTKLLGRLEKVADELERTAKMVREVLTESNEPSPQA